MIRRFSGLELIFTKMPVAQDQIDKQGVISIYKVEPVNGKYPHGVITHKYTGQTFSYPGGTAREKLYFYNLCTDGASRFTGAFATIKKCINVVMGFEDETNDVEDE